MIDHWGEVFFELTFPNQACGFETLLEYVNTHTPEGKTAIFGIEDTGGLGRSCAQWLTVRDKLVKGINPIMSSNKRNRHPHRSKTDRIDALTVAKVLITDYDQLPTVTPDEYYYALRQLANRREQLVKTSCTSCFMIFIQTTETFSRTSSALLLSHFGPVTRILVCYRALDPSVLPLF